MKNVVVLDPSVASGNTGDLVIAEAALGVVEEAFSGCMISRLSMQQPLGRPGRRLLRTADLALFAGTNMLGPQLWFRRQFKADFASLFQARDKIVVFGVGKNTAACRPDLLTRWIYRQMLSPCYPHSVRDQAAMTFLASAGFDNVQVTGCPTTARVDARARALVVRNAARLREQRPQSVIVTLTDYGQDQARDAALLASIVRMGARDLLFWPQGLGDGAYIEQVARRAQVGPYQWLPPGLRALRAACRVDAPVLFAGTRLHAAMFCLSEGTPSLVLAIDNRVPDFATTFPLLYVLPQRSERLDTGSFAGFYDDRWAAVANIGDRCATWLRETRQLLDGRLN